MKMDNKGSTLVEITAGFLMLVIIMASFIKIINLSSEMTEKAIDLKNDNLEFDKRYYAGQNYNVDGGTAFRSGDDEVIDLGEGDPKKLTLTEWHKQAGSDYYVEWYKDSNNKMVTDDPAATHIPLNNIKLYHIENVRDKKAAKGNIYRYKYSVTTP